MEGRSGVILEDARPWLSPVSVRIVVRAGCERSNRILDPFDRLTTSSTTYSYKKTVSGRDSYPIILAANRPSFFAFFKPLKIACENALIPRHTSINSEYGVFFNHPCHGLFTFSFSPLKTYMNVPKIASFSGA